MSVTHEDVKLFENQGYLRIRGVVPAVALHAIINALADRFGLLMDSPDSWRTMPARNFGIVPIHHHQAQWDLRQHPAVFDAFRGIWGTDRLTICADRPSFHPPSSVVPLHGAHHQLHWDFDPGRERREIQGLVYLTDTPEDRGAFRCAPEIFLRRHELPSFNPLSEPYPVDLSGVPSIPVPGKAGDLIVWKPQMPHCAGPNHSSSPRVAQIVSMIPGVPSSERHEWAGWLEALRPSPWWRGLAGQVDPEPGPPPALTALGRCLSGLDDWPDHLS